MSTDLTVDQLEYLGKVAEWLKSEPTGKYSYGAFFVAEFRVCFDTDDETIGRFAYRDDIWTFVLPESA